MGLLLISAVLFVLGAIFIFEQDANPKRLRDLTVMWIFLAMMIPLAVMLSEHLLNDPSSNWITIFGASIFSLGTLIRFIGRRTLGKYFTYEVAIKPKHRLITTGIYHYIRHPLYTGIFLLWFGAAITLQSIFGLTLVLLLLVPALGYRMRIEEKFLIKTFGKQYRDYQKTSKRLIPFIY